MTLRGESIRVVHPLFQVEGGGSIPTSPLQLSVGEITLDKAMELNALWHSRLPVTDKSNLVRSRELVCFGAECDGVFYASAIWSSPVARLLNGRNWLELRRLAISDDAPPNTATRLLRVMRGMVTKRFPHITALISYQDTDVHAGTIYKAAGWIPTYKNQGRPWDHAKRSRGAAVATGKKIRWQYAL